MRLSWTKLAALLCLAVAGPLVGGSASFGQSGTTAAGTGSKIVSYIDNHDGDAWVVDVDGRARHRLGPGEDTLGDEATLVSPSGKYVAVMETTGVTIYTTAGDRSRRFVLGGSDDLIMPLAWSDDSRYLAVVVTNEDYPSVSGDKLTVIDTKTMAAITVARGVISGASFRPAASDRIVFASARSGTYNAPVNLYTINPSGKDRRTLASDGRSLNPVWGASGIAFDRRSRTVGASPLFQIWLITNTGRREQLSHLVNPLASGLVPVAFDHSGHRLLAELDAQDLDTPWIVDVPSGHEYEIKVKPQDKPHYNHLGSIVAGKGIAPNGSSVLMELGLNPSPTSYLGHGAVAIVPATGGTPKILATDAYGPSWND